MAADWDLLSLFSSELSIPVVIGDDGEVETADVSLTNTQYCFNLRLCNARARQGNSTADCALFFTCHLVRKVSMASPDRFPRHQRFLFELLGADVPRQEFPLSHFFDNGLRLKTIDLFRGMRGWEAAKQSMKNTSSITVKVMIVSAPNPNSIFLNRQIKMFENAKIHGDMTIRVHIERESVDDVDTAPPSKRRKVTSSDEVDRKQQTESQPIELKTYSAVLRCASPYFVSMFDSKMKEADEMAMDIHAESVDDVEGMLFYLFTNQFLEDGRALKLIRLAHLYGCKGLFERCREEIATNLNVQNYMESLKVFNQYEIEKGMDKLIGFGRAHLDQLKTQKSFQELPFVFRSGLLVQNQTSSSWGSCSSFGFPQKL